MSSYLSLLPLPVKKPFAWTHYLLDTVLAIIFPLLITGAIGWWHLYPLIPNISIVYLLAIVGLASTRGRYPAVLASFVSFLAFDFFIVPPLYTFTVNRVEEWIALVVFLVDAIITGQLAAGVRSRAEHALRRERETRTLYDLVRLATREGELEPRLRTIARAIVSVFSPLGVQDCTILQPDPTGKLRVQASASESKEPTALTSDEQAVATWTMRQGRSMGLYDDQSSSSTGWTRLTHQILMHKVRTGRLQHRSSFFIPLKVGQQVVGVLRLVSLNTLAPLVLEAREEGQERAQTQTAFFWAFLDQAAALIERARLRQANLEVEILKRTDALRASLLSSVSHDLRTPLTAIKAAASSLLQKDVQWDEEAKRSFACLIEREADRLNRLVGNLLDLSRIENGALRPEKEWYPLTPLICEVLDRLKPLLQGRTVQTNLPKDVAPVEVDYLMMDQVLTNLIENAVRYTPTTSPIEINLQRHADEVLISIADRGPGIPEADLERVFDKFYRVQDKERAHYSSAGSGLGLAVCRGIVDAHHGRIWAAAREGGGAVFTVALPVGSPEGVVV